MSTETMAAGGAQDTVASAPSKRGGWPTWLNLKIVLGLLAAFWISLWVHTPKGAPYVTNVQSEVLIQGVDIDQTLAIAEQELRKTGFGSVLTLWGIRDQVYTEAQAKKVSDLYFEHIDTMKDYFRIWHLTWAISNVYRNGDAAVRAQLELAYTDSTKRAKAAGGLADAHVNGNFLMGDIHFPARLFVRAHVVASGNPDYLQSLEDYKP